MVQHNQIAINEMTEDRTSESQNNTKHKRALPSLDYGSNHYRSANCRALRQINKPIPDNRPTSNPPR